MIEEATSRWATGFGLAGAWLLVAATSPWIFLVSLEPWAHFTRGGGNLLVQPFWVPGVTTIAPALMATALVLGLALVIVPSMRKADGGTGIVVAVVAAAGLVFWKIHMSEVWSSGALWRLFFFVSLLAAALLGTVARRRLDRVTLTLAGLVVGLALATFGIFVSNAWYDLVVDMRSPRLFASLGSFFSVPYGWLIVRWIRRSEVPRKIRVAGGAYLGAVAQVMTLMLARVLY